jgi:hypothetical protein
LQYETSCASFAKVFIFLFQQRIPSGWVMQLIIFSKFGDSWRLTWQTIENDVSCRKIAIISSVNPSSAKWKGLTEQGLVVPDPIQLATFSLLNGLYPQ